MLLLIGDGLLYRFVVVYRFIVWIVGLGLSLTDAVTDPIHFLHYAIFIELFHCLNVFI